MCDIARVQSYLDLAKRLLDAANAQHVGEYKESLRKQAAAASDLAAAATLQYPHGAYLDAAAALISTTRAPVLSDEVLKQVQVFIDMCHTYNLACRRAKTA
ncbi:hypothetical protein GCM10025787_03290 [Saccharopolyspora rosea]|uniref:Uncharacterized protein n=1 Tax=Saccharopolyspora rosea TaxID=524884 RepID=A0ABW3FSD1_9PSEU